MCKEIRVPAIVVENIVKKYDGFEALKGVSFTVERGLKKGLVAEKYLKNNDSYNFFSGTGELIFTGPTNTNIMDIVIILVS